MKKIAVVALLAAACAAPAFATDYYVVGAIGQSRMNALNKSELDSSLIANTGPVGFSSTLDRTDLGYKILVGYQFNNYLAVEGGYVNLGKSKYSATFPLGTVDMDAKASGLTLAAVGRYLINESFSVFGKLGVINAKVEETIVITDALSGASFNVSMSATKMKSTWGGGATYNINKQVGVRVEFEQFRKLGDANETGESNVNLISAGLVYKF